MSDLREQLSTRLLQAFGKGRARYMEPDGTVNVVTVWNCVADECIRQMEWARHQTIEIVCSALDSGRSNPIAGPMIRAATPEPLTAAPDDWRPEP